MLSNEILRFLSEIEIDITTGGPCEDMIFIFTIYKSGLFKKSRLTFFKNSNIPYSSKRV